jgi:hypothetical protein
MWYNIINEMYKGNYSFLILASQILLGVIQIVIQLKKKK